MASSAESFPRKLPDFHEAVENDGDIVPRADVVDADGVPLDKLEDEASSRDGEIEQDDDITEQLMILRKALAEAERQYDEAAEWVDKQSDKPNMNAYMAWKQIDPEDTLNRMTEAIKSKINSLEAERVRRRLRRAALRVVADNPKEQSYLMAQERAREQHRRLF